MSARKINISSTLSPATAEDRQVRLTLSSEAVVIHKGGIEFRTARAYPRWVEMTVTLQSALDESKVSCSGVVIDCTGNKTMGYHVSMIFTGLTPQAEATLNTMAVAHA